MTKRHKTQQKRRVTKPKTILTRVKREEHEFMVRKAEKDCSTMSDILRDYIRSLMREEEASKIDSRS